MAGMMSASQLNSLTQLLFDLKSFICWYGAYLWKLFKTKSVKIKDLKLYVLNLPCDIV